MTTTIDIDVAGFLAVLAPGQPVPGMALELADLWEAVEPCPDRLLLALAAAGVEVDITEAVEVFIRLRELFGEFGQRRVVGATAADELFGAWLEFDADEVGLLLDVDLADRLPLLELAEDIAHHAPGGRLQVEAVRRGSMGHFDGLFSQVRGTAFVLLDVGTARDLEEVWAHELSHALDPELAGVDVAGAEAFADALAPLLLEHEPRTIDEARPLVVRGLNEVRRLRRQVLAGTASVYEVITWALGDAIGWRSAHDLVAAAHGRAPQPRGVNVDPVGPELPRQGTKVATKGRPRPDATCVDGAAGRAADAPRITEGR